MSHRVVTKTELVKVVSEATGQSQALTAQFLDASLQAIMDSLARGDDVRFIGFGTFCLTHRPQRTGRNPMTGAAIQIEATHVARFKPGQLLKKALSRLTQSVDKQQ